MTTEKPQMTVEVSPTGPLTPEQGTARSAFTEFCWNLQLARARKPNDPGLSNEDSAMISRLLTMSDDAVAAEGKQLWSAWMATEGHTVAPAIFDEQSMQGFLGQLNAVRKVHEESTALRAALGHTTQLPHKESHQM